MILELDCGNTRVKWRVRNDGLVVMRGTFLSHQEFGDVVSKELASIALKRVLIGSVLGDEYARKLASWSITNLGINPEFAVSELCSNGVVNGYQQPEKLGVDRWLAILASTVHTVAARVIVDCGSAITVDLVTSQGEHLGGYIAPGLRLMREMLESKTAAIKLGAIGYPENSFPGRSTVAAIKSAEYAMVAGLIIQAKLAMKNYEKSEAELLITGGDGEWLAAMLKEGAFYEDLVLDGLDMALVSADTQKGERK